MTAENQIPDNPSFRRNIEPITSVLRSVLPAESANILEIGSGAGHHVTSLASEFPHLTFWPSEYNPANLETINGMVAQSGCTNARPARRIDIADQAWLADKSVARPAQFEVILCFNVIHISPWKVTTGLFESAGKLLSPHGQLVLYGPYRVDGEHTAPSNMEFEKWLKARDPENGVRDIGEVEAVANSHNLVLMDFHAMPANNFMPVFGRN